MTDRPHVRTHPREIGWLGTTHEARRVNLPRIEEHRVEVVRRFAAMPPVEEFSEPASTAS